MCESESEWFQGGGFVLVRLEKWSCPQGSAKSLPDTEASQQHVANAIRLHIFHRVSSRADRVKLAQGLCQNWGHGFSLWRHWFCRELSYTGRQIQQLCISPNPPNKHFRISNALDDICLYSIMSEQPHILGSRQYSQELFTQQVAKLPGPLYQSVLSTCILPLRLSKISHSKKSPEILNMFGGKKLKDLTEEDREVSKDIKNQLHSIDCYMIWCFQVFLSLQTRGYSKFCFFVCHQARRSATVVSFKLSIKRLRGHRFFCVYVAL